METSVPQILAYIIVFAVIFIIVMYIINLMKNTRAAFVVRNKRKEMPVFSIEDIGRKYVALGVVKSSNTFYQRAEVELIEQAQKMGADAIVGCKGESTTINSAKNGINTIYDFYGTAVKFV